MQSPRFGKWIIIGFGLIMVAAGAIWWWRPAWLRLALYRSMLAAGPLSDDMLVESYVLDGETNGFRGVYLGIDSRRRITIADQDGVKSFSAANPLTVNCQPPVRLQQNGRMISEREIWYDLGGDEGFLEDIGRQAKLDDFYRLAADKIQYNAQVHLVQDVKTLEVIYALVIPCSQ